jgi:hypothetical protein
VKTALRWWWRAAVCAVLCASLAPLILGSHPSAARAAALLPASAGRPVSLGGPVSPGRQVGQTGKTGQVGHVEHVVIVGVSGLRWTFADAASTPALWRLAGQGSVGALVDYAEQPLACPDDGWLTLNGGARAQGPRPCAALPAVVPDGTGARIPAMAQIVSYNQQFHESPDWGLLASLSGCATAVGPGAALALATPSGAVFSYLPRSSEITAPVLARCPLTVIDLGALSFPERSAATVADHVLARIVADLPAGTLLLVTAPGAALGGRPHLRAVVISGPGFGQGLLHSAATRQPGIVTLTDLTPTVAGWLGRSVPAYITGARLTSTPRASLAAAVRGLIGRDTAEQVWMSTHGWFFTGYALADLLLLGVPVLMVRGADPGQARRRARWWRTGGVLAAAVPVGTFLAGLVPWWMHAHPAAWLYGMSVSWALVVAAAALAGPWRRDTLGPFGMICLFTLAVLGVDVMTGSRLQLETPFGLSLIEGGRFYGIGNEALGVYCVCALAGAAWVGMLVSRRYPRDTRAAVLAASAVGLFAVVASGWPGFGAKVGGTIALVPCLIVLVLWLGGIRISWLRAAPVAVSGLALFAVFALVSYFFPAAGVSDMGAFAGSLLHGQGGALLERKVSSNIDTLTVSVFSWLIPVVAVAAWLALWRPAALRLRTLPQAFAVEPVLRTVAWLIWVVLVIGWFADDSGVIVPATALPFALPLMISMAASVSCAYGGARYLGTAFAGSSVAGQAPSR